MLTLGDGRHSGNCTTAPNQWRPASSWARPESVMPGSYRLRASSKRDMHSTQRGQPPGPYLWVGWPQPVHGPTWPGGHVGAGGLGLSVSMPVIVRTGRPGTLGSQGAGERVLLLEAGQHALEQLLAL
jgi:hypothetical protein